MSIKTRRIKVGTPAKPDFPSGVPSLLVEETKAMERKRRRLEQQGERKFGSVKERDHSLDERAAAPEGELQNDILQHPELADKPQYDGTDSNLNPVPALNTDARREYDNAKNEQNLEYQMRMGLNPNFNKAPKPPGP